MRVNILFFLVLLFNANLNAQSIGVDEFSLCKEQLEKKSYHVLLSLSGRYLIYSSSGAVSFEQPSTIGIWDCLTDESIESDFYCSASFDLDFCLPFQSIVGSTDTTLTITHYGMLPYKKDWQLVSLPVFEQVLYHSEQSIYRIDEQFLLQPVSIALEKSKEVMQEYKQLKNQGIDKLYTTMDGVDSMDWVVLKLFVCSIGGNETCEKLFLNLEDDFPGSMDGVVGETYSRWFGIYQLYKGRPLRAY